ncbi:PREDICTED: WD repeat-containing protein 70-like [Priapulus caudatus]|uniref:WD repeat-containing protein 70-like n=1 Tax=Priapulus caudatus TaxID=37621 RepID=A0ABM1DUH0_PRICU|nr:PREDICTED: WD repeat-containing protein 70-like [Priapulus caudatus]
MADPSKDMAEIMGFGGFGKKARTFDLDAIFEQTRRTAMERSQKTLAEREVDKAAGSVQRQSRTAAPHSSKSQASIDKRRDSDDDDDDDEELIGPPLPPAAANSQKEPDDENGSDGDELIGPPLPNPTEDSDEEEDDHEMKYGRKVPDSHEIVLLHGDKTVSAMTWDPAGARVATGGFDYDVRLWDFAGMDANLRSFRTLRPCECHQIKSLQYSITGDSILVASGNAQAKVIDRDGFDVMECPKGDQYITDMATTKGHAAMLNMGCWHPRDKTEFMTCSIDNTVRLWSVEDSKKHKAVIKPRSKQGRPTVPTACAYSNDGKLVAAACQDGSIQMWDHRKQFVNTVAVCRTAHQPGTDTSCLCFSYSGALLASRGGLADDSLKLWDVRSMRAPLQQKHDLENLFAMTDCLFSPDDRMVVTGVSVRRGQGMGELLFFDRDTFDKSYSIPVCEGASVVKCIWHPKLNQIMVGTSNGQAKVYYDPEISHRGAKLCVVKTMHKVKQIEFVADDPIITPHALPMFREERPRSTKKINEKARADPVKSHRPDLPFHGPGAGGRLSASGGTMASYISKKYALARPIENKSLDPRQAILRHAEDAAENPQWTRAYLQTQPEPVFQKEGEEKKEPDETVQPPWKKKKL